jgi:hypothetical protein
MAISLSHSKQPNETSGEQQHSPWNMHDKHRVRVVLIIMVLVAVVIIGLAACGPANSQSDAVSVVQRYLDAKKNNDFSAWKSTLWTAQKDGSNFTPSFEKPGDLGVLSLTIGKVAVSDAETAQIQKRYSGSDLAKIYGWSDEFIAKNMIAVSAQYTVQYDNTKTPNPDGEQIQVFYLVRDNPDSGWLIWDSGSPSQ